MWKEKRKTIKPIRREKNTGDKPAMKEEKKYIKEKQQSNGNHFKNGEGTWI